MAPGPGACFQLSQTGLAMPEPALERRYVAADLALSECSHSAALRMTTHDDVRDGQVCQAELNGRCFRSEMRGLRAFLVGRNEIADVTDDEHVARLRRGEHIG